MMRSINRRLIFILLGSLVVLAVAVGAQAQDAGTSSGAGVLDGQVTNGTDGGPEIGAGVPVALHIYEAGNESASLETVTDANGAFRFEGLDTNPDLEYWPEATYLGVSYSNDTPYQFSSGETKLNAALTVYETTEDDSAITLDSAHFIMESYGQVLRISEIHLYGNTGDRTYIGHADAEGQRTTVFIPLPDGAVGLAFDEETAADRFIEVDGGIQDTEPVVPGQETSLAYFSYHLVVSGTQVPLDRRFSYPVTTLNILVAQPGLSLSSDQLQDMGLQSFQGQNYGFFALGGLMPDETLSMQLMPEAVAADGTAMPGTTGGTDLAAAGPVPGDNQGRMRLFGFALAALAVVGVVVYSLSSRPEAVTASGPNLTANAQSRRLLAELIDLEEAYAAGQVDDTTYERERAEKYDALKSL
jgi:hypothetical protein